MQRTLLALIFLLLAASTCPAGQHPVTVTRTSDDFYAAFDRDILIKTRFCSVRAFQERALLRSDRFGELVFTNGTRCAVDTVYARKRLRRGTHKVTVTREGEGVYRLAGSETLLFASRCSTLALQDEAVLECRTAFPACCTCMVEPAGWRAFSRPSLIDIGPRPGLDDPPGETAVPARLLLPAAGLSRRGMGRLRNGKTVADRSATAFFVLVPGAGLEPAQPVAEGF